MPYIWSTKELRLVVRSTYMFPVLGGVCQYIIENYKTKNLKFTSINTINIVLELSIEIMSLVKNIFKHVLQIHSIK